jgi:hypothetical protein
MKNYQPAGIIILLCSVFLASAQSNDSLVVRWKKAMAENDEYIHALLVIDKNVLDNAKVLIHNIGTKQKLFTEMAQYHSDEMARSLHSSESYLDRLEKATDIALDEIGVQYCAGLHKHYRYAIEQQRGIQAELKKALPEKSVIKMKTVVIYAEMKKAEDEQKKMNEKAGVAEPGEPGPVK